MSYDWLLERPLLFIHIPKNGGSTFIKALQEARVSHERVTGHRFIHEHGTVPADCTPVAIIRHPVDRIVSWYNFLSPRAKNPTFHEFVKYQSPTHGFRIWCPQRAWCDARTRLISFDELPAICSFLGSPGLHENKSRWADAHLTPAIELQIERFFGTDFEWQPALLKRRSANH